MRAIIQELIVTLDTINLLILEKPHKQDTGKVALHTHPFWQLEIALHGPISYLWNGQQDRLHTGDMLLIPPGVEHAFSYEMPGCSWFTLKFEYDSTAGRMPEGAVIRQSLINDKLVALLQTMVSDSIMKPYEKRFVEGFVQSLFAILLSADVSTEGPHEHALVRNVTERVRARGGKPIQIQELSEQMGYTRSYLSKQFRLMTGEHLKSFIDRVRLDKAKEMLLYSEFVIAEITESLGFKDAFSFSRFFKNGAGESPRAYRKRHSGT